MADGTSPIDNKHPLFGWNAKLFVNLNAANGNQITYLTADPDNTENLISARVERPGGLHRVGVIATISRWVTGGPDSRVTVILEGSNDGLESTSPTFDRNPNDHWNTISSLSISDPFDGTVVPQIRILGAGTAVLPLSLLALEALEGDPNIDVRRYRYLRVRAEVVVEDVSLDFDLDVQVSGIGGDGQRFDLSDTLIQPMVPPGVVNVTTEPFGRPAGVRYMTSQVVVENIVLDAVSGYQTYLEGALEEDGPYFVMGPLESVTGILNTLNQSDFFFQNSGGSDSIDMDPFKFFRYRLIGVGVPTNGDLYTIAYITEFDGGDVLEKGNSQSDLQPDLSRMFLRVVFGSPTQPLGAGTDVNIRAEVQDISGNPIRGVEIPIYVAVSDSDVADGIVSPSVAATITGLGGFVYFGTGTTRALGKTGTDGTIPLRISNGGAPGTVYLQAVQYAGFGNASPQNLPGRLLISSEIATLTFL